MGSKALLTSIYKIRKNPNKSYIKNFSEDPNISEKKLKKYFKSLVINRNNKKWLKKDKIVMEKIATKKKILIMLSWYMYIKILWYK